jgi:acyl carrier protein
MGERTIIRDEVVALLASALAADPARLTPATSLYDDLGADSLTVMEILAGLEERLGIELPDSNAIVSSLRTVGDLVEAFVRGANESSAVPASSSRHEVGSPEGSDLPWGQRSAGPKPR